MTDNEPVRDASRFKGVVRGAPVFVFLGQRAVFFSILADPLPLGVFGLAAGSGFSTLTLPVNTFGSAMARHISSASHDHHALIVFMWGAGRDVIRSPSPLYGEMRVSLCGRPIGRGGGAS
jgi:hypothetical protein